MSRGLARALPYLVAPLSALVVLRKLALERGVPFSPYSDLIAQFLSLKLGARAALLGEHAIPAWDPAMNAGTPLLANPQSGLFSPLEWPFWLAPPNVAASVHALLAVAVAGLTMLLFARRVLGGHPAAVLASVTYALSFHQIAAVYTGWTPNLSTYALLPLLPWAVCWTVDAAVAAPGATLVRSLARAPVVALVVALLCVQGDMQQVYYTGLGSGGYALWLLFRAEPSARRAGSVALLFGAVCGLLLAAPALLPRLEYARESTRTLEDYAFFVSSAPHARELARIFDPQMLGGSRPEFWEKNFYVGIAALPLVGVALARDPRHAGILSGLVALAVLLSFDTPLLHALHALLPGLWLFRQSSRLLVTAEIPLSLVAALGARALVEPGPGAPPRFLGALLGAGAVVASFAVASTEASSLAPLWLMTLGALALPAVARVPRVAALAALTVLPVLDAESRFAPLFEVRPAAEVLTRPAELDKLARGPDRGRTLAVGRAALPYGMAGLFGVDLVNGYSGIMISRFVEYIGVMQFGAPGGERAAPTVWNDVNGLANAELLRALDVRHVVTTRRLPLEAAGFDLAEHFERVRSYVFYRGMQALPRYVYVAREPLGAAYLATEIRSAPDDPKRLLGLLAELPSARIAYVSGVAPGNGQRFDARGSVRELSRGANRYAYNVNVGSRSFVILSQIAYPGWSATLDGALIPLERVDHALLGCFVPPGRHRLELSMGAPALVLGGELALVGLVLFVAVALLVPTGKSKRASRAR